MTAKALPVKLRRHDGRIAKRHQRRLPIAPNARSPPAAAQEGFDMDVDDVPTVHFLAGDRVVSACPAFEDYMCMFINVCDMMVCVKALSGR
jgi:hypothetical protein